MITNALTIDQATELINNIRSAEGIDPHPISRSTIAAAVSRGLLPGALHKERGRQPTWRTPRGAAEYYARNPPPPPNKKILDDEARIIDEMTADGRTTKEIAAKLHVHPRTISRYLKSVGETYGNVNTTPLDNR